jgi:hypothetical protein
LVAVASSDKFERIHQSLLALVCHVKHFDLRLVCASESLDVQIEVLQTSLRNRGQEVVELIGHLGRDP